MKHFLLLSLWGATALGSRCRPGTSSHLPGSEASESSGEYGTSVVDSAEASSTTAGNSGYYPPPGGSASQSSGSGEFTSSDTTWLPGNTQSHSTYWTPGANSTWLPGNTETSQSYVTYSGASSETTWLPGNTETTPGQPGNTATTPGQPGNTETGIDTGTISGQPGNTDSTWLPGNTETTPGQPGNTDTTPGQPGNTQTGINTETGINTGTGIDTQTGINTETTPGQPGNTGSTWLPGNTDTTPGQPGNTQTTPGQPGNTESTATVPGGTTETGINTETGLPDNTDSSATLPGGTTETGLPGNTDTTPGLPGNTQTTPGLPGNTDSTATAPGGTSETGINTQTGVNTQTGTNTETGVNTETGLPGNTETTPGQPGNTDSTATGPAGTTETGINTETTPGQPGNTDSTTAGPVDTTETGINTRTDTNTETGTNTETTAGQPGNTDSTATGPADTTNTGTNTETTAGQPGNTDSTATGPTGTTETGVNTETTAGEPGNTDSTTSGPAGTTETGLNTETGTNTETTSGEPGSTETTAGEPGNTETTAGGPGNTDSTTTGPADTTETGINTETGVNTETTATDSATVPSTTDVGATQTTGAGATITTAPITSTTDSGGALITSTMTEPPAGFAPTTVSDHPEWTTNTWITTTSDGSSEPTIVPVLVGCSACGGAGSGIIIFGFPPFINTLFNFPNFPKFSFPCIPPGCSTPPDTSEDGDDGDDDNNSTQDEASETTEVSSTCTEQVTASDCLVACTTYTGVGADPTPECITTCTRTQTGCSATGITTTTSVEACSATGDGACLNCAEEIGLVTSTDESDNPTDDANSGEIEDDGSETGNLKKRDSSLEKRGAAVIFKKLGSNSLGCPVTKHVEFPEYPGGETVLTSDAAGTLAAPETSIKRWFIMTRDAQCIPSISQVAAAAYHAKPAVGRRPQLEVATIDHVFEKSWLKDFFTNILDKNVPDVSTTTGAQTKLNCKDLAYYTDDSTGTGPNQLEAVFNRYPSNTNYLDDFIGMDDYINGQSKGVVATPETVRTKTTNLLKSNNNVGKNTQWATASTLIEEKLQWVERLAIGVEMMNDADGIQAMIRQNGRIWSRLKDIDDSAINCKKDPSAIAGKWSFADRYKAFMTDRFDGTQTWSINKAVTDAKTSMLARLQTDLNNVKNPTSTADQTRLTNFKARKAILDAAVYSVTIAWDWTYTLTRRQDEGDGGSCPIETVSQSLTTLATSVVSQSQTDEPTETSDVAEPTTTSVAAPITTSEAPPPVTTTEVADPTPITPLARGGIVCHNEDDFPGHADISSSSQDDFSTDFSGLSGPNGDDDLFDGAGSVNLNTEDGHGVSYAYSVEWVSGCVTTQDTQDFRFPLPRDGIITAYLIVREAFTKCDNGGVGGQEQVGCLLYDFTGGR
ncbi:hypothetical protein G7Z17_g409 [Cylindrodendrum hubeiense]|uniref:Uncharacterized protein n=1 Tax=Cylindrodendrum hubeiense TaxID=595255 RepID=A0A9P5HKD9_9HYPO|nr:hypothetical protein G7Z17_g409 [Cylindrodendrum hubeiense]